MWGSAFGDQGLGGGLARTSGKGIYKEHQESMGFPFGNATDSFDKLRSICSFEGKNPLYATARCRLLIIRSKLRPMIARFPRGVQTGRRALYRVFWKS